MYFKRRDLARTTLPPDYMYWVLTFHKRRLGWDDEKLLNLGRSESVQLSLDIAQDWTESCQNILRLQETTATSTLAFLTAPANLPTWQTNALVSLIGDAAHLMIPVGGVGATTAFRDAAALYDVIVQGINSGTIAKYEDEMRQSAEMKIKMSSAGARGFFGMKSVEDLHRQTLFREISSSHTTRVSPIQPRTYTGGKA